jgi:hypothetical protein
VVETGNSGNGAGLSEAERRKIFEKGVEEGRRRTTNGAGEPSWHEIATACSARPELRRDDREREFVNDMVWCTIHGGRLSEKQENWLRAIYARVRR